MHDSFSRVCDKISGPESTRPGQEGPIQYLVRGIFIAASRGPGIIRMIWCSCHFSVVWAHLQRVTEDARRHVVGLFSMAFLL